MNESKKLQIKVKIQRIQMNKYIEKERKIDCQIYVCITTDPCRRDC